jgi:hypothetical protein
MLIPFSVVLLPPIHGMECQLVGNFCPQCYLTSLNQEPIYVQCKISVKLPHFPDITAATENCVIQTQHIPTDKKSHIFRSTQLNMSQIKT